MLRDINYILGYYNEELMYRIVDDPSYGCSMLDKRGVYWFMPEENQDESTLEQLQFYFERRVSHQIQHKRGVIYRKVMYED